MKRFILFFTLLSSLTQWAQDITKAEYALDIDNGYGLNNVITVSAGTDINPSIPITINANMASGFHKLYLRVKNANGWSHTLRQNIEIIPVAVVNNLIEGEYFVDVEPEFNQGNPFTVSAQSTNITQDILAQLANNLNTGFHKLYFRLKDQANHWSHTIRYNFEVIENNGNINIVAAEFFFTTDPLFGQATPVTVVASSPNNDGTWTFNVPYPVGPYNFTDKLYLRVLDQNGKWSHTTLLDAVDSSLTANVFDQVSLRVFPNPTTDFVQFHTQQNQIFDVAIYDALGKKVGQQQANNDSPIDLTNVPKGLYLLQTTDQNKQSNTFKIIKK